MERPKVSIITVSLNSYNTIEDTIKSVINQTYDNIEYIIIDGGSTDGTVDIIKQYGKYIAYWVSEKDEGLYSAMNKGIEVAHGEIIGTINSDDWYELNTVERIVDVFSQKDIDIVHGDIVVIDEDGNSCGSLCPEPTMDNIYYSPMYFQCTFFVRKEVYFKYGIFDPVCKTGGDYKLYLNFYNNGCKFFYLHENLSYFRKGGLSTATRTWWTNMETKKISLKNLESLTLEEEVKKEYLDRIREHHEYRRSRCLRIYLEKRLNRKINGDYLRLLLSKFIKKKNKSRYIIFGAGCDGRKICKYLMDCGGCVECFVDNSTMKQGNNVLGIEVKNPETLKMRRDDENLLIIVASIEFEKEIMFQLEGFGLAGRIEYIGYEGVMNEISRSYLANRMKWVFSARKHVWKLGDLFKKN